MKDLKIYLAIASVLLIIYLVAEYNKPADTNWSETLINTDKIPFGTYIIYNRLNDIFPNAEIKAVHEPIYNALADSATTPACYIIIGNTVKITETDYQKLTQYVKDGNEVFLSANYFGNYLQDKLKFGLESEFKAANIKLRFLNPNIDSNKYYTLDHEASNVYFNTVDSTKACALGENAFHHLNFIKYSIGKGSLYLNTTPLMFSNFSILNREGATYASTALSHLKNNNNLLWDEYYTQGGDDDESIFRVFLRTPSLRWAFYISFFSLVAFVIFEAKRRQRIIPVVEPLQNSTVDFVNVVGQVYYEQRNNANIAQKIVSYFLEHIRATYYLKTTVLDEEFINTLSQKTGVGTDLINSLVYQFTIVRGGVTLTDNELITLNQNIEQFYSQAK